MRPRTSTEVGVDISVKNLRENFDAVVMAGGAEDARSLSIPGAELPGVRLAMEFLTQQNKRNAGDDENRAAPRGTLTATGKHVIVIGGGDTGSDCVGTSHRHGAASVTSIELLERPPDERADSTPWPQWPLMFRTSSSHLEGGERIYARMTKSLVGEDGRVKELHGIEVRFGEPDESGRPQMEEVPGSEFVLPADLVLLAMGFLGPEKNPLLSGLGVELDQRGNVKTTDWKSSVDGVFGCGDARRGQSLVVWAIWEGRECARAVDEYLTGSSRLPSTPQLL